MYQDLGNKGGWWCETGSTRRDGLLQYRANPLLIRASKPDGHSDTAWTPSPGKALFSAPVRQVT